MSSIKPTGPIDLDARQVKLVGILLKMDEQELPRPDGGPLVRAPNRDEIRVRIDFGGTKGKNRILFLRPSLLDIALERH
jgi:hypothetical protein